MHTGFSSASPDSPGMVLMWRFRHDDPRWNHYKDNLSELGDDRPHHIMSSGHMSPCVSAVMAVQQPRSPGSCWCVTHLEDGALPVDV